MGNYPINFKGIILNPKVNTFIGIMNFGWVDKAKENTSMTDFTLISNLWFLPSQRMV